MFLKQACNNCIIPPTLWCCHDMLIKIKQKQSWKMNRELKTPKRVVLSDYSITIIKWHTYSRVVRVLYFLNKIKCCLLKCILNLWSMSNWCLTSIVTFINMISVIHQLFFRKCLIESGVNNSNDIEMMIEKKLCFILQCQDSYQNEERHGSLVYSTKLENYYKGLEVASSQLKIGKLIGRGAFGRVYEGHLHNTKDRDTKRVAVKRLKGDHEGWPLSVHWLFL